jgi:predicted 2-oxoglutarate/Fe(II)-dependent dioxygenase YbiX
MQLARYEPTGFYAAHRDNALGPNETILDAGLLGWLRTHGQRRRAITAILYLNAPEWDCALSGGALRCYPDATDACAGGALGSAEMEGAGRHVDVVPTGGSLLLFDSRRLLHQVNPVTGSDDRFALTAWIFGADTHWLHGGPLVEKSTLSIVCLAFNLYCSVLSSYMYPFEFLIA